LFTDAVPSSEEVNSEPSIADYTSNILRLFVEDIEQGREVQVLDVGRTCNRNINFFARRVKRLFVCDMFLRLNQDRLRGFPPSQAWRDLDYPPQSFDGLLLWDLIDRLDENEGHRLVELCHTLVKPGGKIMLFAQNEKAVSAVVNAFVIGEDYELNIHSRPHLNLPLHCRQNRDIMNLLAPFTPIKSFIYRSGLREFLFQNN